MKNFKYPKTCLVCKKEFKANQPRQKYCCEVCRKKAYYETSGRISKKFNNLSSGSVWKISEMAVATELMKKGFTVFYALSTDSYCDLIAVNDKKILHVEARTGYLNKYTGSLLYPTGRKGRVNVFGIYERNTGTVYFYDLNKKEIKDISL